MNTITQEHEQESQSKGLLWWDMLEKATWLTTEQINEELNKIFDED